MQKFSEKLKNTPGDASLVSCSVSSGLNRDQSLSVRSKVLSENSREGNPRQHTGGLKDKVYVLNRNGQSLMPCSPCKARKLLSLEKAQIKTHSPFVIQLSWDCETNTQEVVIGIDSGAKNIGFAAVSEKEELISGTVVLENGVKSRLDDRRMYRRNRRNRKWYRKPRFNNRKRKENWLPPSVERQYQSHLKVIKKIKSVLPVSAVNIEVGNFDIQALERPEIESTDYQQGDRYGYENTKAFLFAREHGRCQLCGKEVFGKKVNLHHIIPRSKGGTDKPNNLALLHNKCHEKLHKKGLEKTLKKNRQYKEATFMNIIKWRFKNDLDCSLTFGYTTFCRRLEIGLPKSHANDAFVIAGGSQQERVKPFEISQKRKNNRCLQKNRKGFAPAVRKQRYPIQPGDLVLIQGDWAETKGSHCKGSRLMVNKKSVNIKQVESVFHTGTFKWRTAIPPTPEGVGLLAG